MGKMRFAVGALGIIVGFFAYQYGLFLTLKLSDRLGSWTMAYVPWIGSVELLGATLQLVGGVIAIAGLLICMSWIGSQREAEASIRPQRTVELVTQAPDSAPRCKFCGAIIESGLTFCPSCQRAQT